ncbi:protein LURP-one-related 5-like isoform X2 [Ananas comosus]|nr:protein LURP-one-related 5-like isoform X2 [Ananas comosus]
MEMEMEMEMAMAMAMAMVAVVGEEYCAEGERELTVRKTSVFYPGDGFAAYDHRTGDLVFRVDTYALADRRQMMKQLVLMDPHGASILTVRRKWPSLHQRWEGFKGERIEGQKPLFTVRRSSIFGGDRSVVAVEVHAPAAAAAAAVGEVEYRIEGSFAQRCCRVLYGGGGGMGGRVAAAEEEGGGDGMGMVVAEIKRKVDSCAHGAVVLGRDVFSLCLAPRFDSAFAMGLVLVLDQISGDDDDDHDDDEAVSVNAATLLEENDCAIDRR